MSKKKAELVKYPILTKTPKDFEDSDLIHEKYIHIFEWAAWKGLSTQSIKEYPLSVEDFDLFAPNTMVIDYCKIVIEFSNA